MLVAVKNRSSEYITEAPILKSSHFCEQLRMQESGPLAYAACELNLDVELFPSPALWRGKSFQAMYEGLRIL